LLASVLKFSTVFGATSGHNSTTIVPSVVSITATSFVFTVFFSSFFGADSTGSAHIAQDSASPNTLKQNTIFFIVFINPKFV